MTTGVAIYRRTYDYQTYSNGNLDGDFTSGLTAVQKENTVVKGGSVRNYRKIIASGGNATTTLSGVKWSIEQQEASLRHWLQHKQFVPPIGSVEIVLRGNLFELNIPAGIPTLDVSEDSAKNLALTRYYSNLAAISSRFKGMVMTGELKQSLSMIRHPARALRHGVGHYLSFLRKKAGTVPKRRRPSFVRKTWLEYSYGWRPLIKDIDGAIQAFYASKHAHPIFEMVKGTSRHTLKHVEADIFNYDVGAGHFVRGGRESEEEVFVKYFGIQHSTGQGVPNSHKYGFSPWEFVPTIYELIPYSFLVDYFSNIGNIVSSWSYRFIANGWTARTVRREYRQQVVGQTYVWNPNGFNPDDYFHGATGSPGSASFRVVQVNRVPDVPLELPSLELRVPGRWDQWVSIAALTVGLEKARKALAR
jgi:hypothetical protein